VFVLVLSVAFYDTDTTGPELEGNHVEKQGKEAYISYYTGIPLNDIFPFRRSSWAYLLCGYPAGKGR
jgi:hypothetical protein